MSLDFIVYCKKEPDADDLASFPHAEDYGVHNNKRNINWTPADTHIEISIDKNPSIYSAEYDKSEIKKMVSTARSKGFGIPEALLRKFQIDGELENTLLEAATGTQYNEPTCYVKTDTELYSMLKSYAHLPETFPELSVEWDILRFSEGNPLYKVKLSTPTEAEKEGIRKMANLGLYIAKTCDGILYDPQTHTIGEPDVQRISDSASEFMKGITPNIEEIAKNLGIIPKDLDKDDLL